MRFEPLEYFGSTFVPGSVLFGGRSAARTISMVLASNRSAAVVIGTRDSAQPGRSATLAISGGQRAALHLVRRPRHGAVLAPRSFFRLSATWQVEVGGAVTYSLHGNGSNGSNGSNSSSGSGGGSGSGSGNDDGRSDGEGRSEGRRDG